MTLHELFLTVLLVFPHKINNEQAKSEFDKAIVHVLKNEGGLSNDKSDRGGITNYGISYNFLKRASAQEKDLMSKVDLNGNKKIDSYDISNMTKKEAEDIYKEEWWNKYGYGNLDYQPLATKIFDISVNMGPMRAAIILRKACLSFNYPSNMKNSPYLSVRETNFINSLTKKEKDKIIMNIISISIDFYQSLAKNNPSQQKYLKGWIKRARESF